ncbi:MAG TPA: hypothetical protein VNV66_02385 [Pilimelia sp.]|nr:hypothetical protein [Pilimelia sp.]
MTPNHEHATLFVAPAASPAGKAGEEGLAVSQPPVDGSAEAMRQLRNPFAVGPARTG